jgi:hypothetical protein
VSRLAEPQKSSGDAPTVQYTVRHWGMLLLLLLLMMLLLLLLAIMMMVDTMIES